MNYEDYMAEWKIFSHVSNGCMIESAWQTSVLSLYTFALSKQKKNTKTEQRKRDACASHSEIFYKPRTVPGTKLGMERER